MKQDSNRSATQADACQSKNKTIEALTKAMAKVSGMEETVMLVYCHNKQQTTTSAFVGETESLTCGLQVIFDHIAEQRAHPGEMAITRSILEAVAAADLRHKGQLTDTIRMYKDQMQPQQTEVKPGNKEYYGN